MPEEEPRRRWENGVWLDAAVLIRIHQYRELVTVQRDEWRQRVKEVMSCKTIGCICYSFYFKPCLQ
jgi:hypothetical protein